MEIKKGFYSFIVAIDPDCEQSGIACIDLEKKQIWIDKMPFAKILEYFQAIRNEKVKLIIEAGYLIKKANWHCHKNTFISGSIGEKTGRNHQTAILLVEMANHYNLKVEAVKPLKKCWKGKEGKITAAELNSILLNGGFNALKKTNQDVRDAALLAWVYAGLPIRLTTA